MSGSLLMERGDSIIPAFPAVHPKNVSSGRTICEVSHEAVWRRGLQ